MVPGARLRGDAGVTAIETTGEVVRVADPVMLPEAALIMVEPCVRVEVTSPSEPGLLLTSATAVFEELQVTDMFTMRKELSENVPVAMNCIVVPGAMLAATGVTESETNRGGGAGSFVPQPKKSIGNNRPAITVIHEKNLFFIASEEKNAL